MADAAGLPNANPPKKLGPATDEERTLLETLQSYKAEAVEARKGGPNGRDDKWSENLDLYWNRYNFGPKAQWQSQAVMPEVPSFVDRFAAALKEALIASPGGGFFDVHDPADEERDMAQAIERMMNVWLSVCGNNQLGHKTGFPAVFEEQVKLGALMATSAIVTWRDDTEYGRVGVETVDPRLVWMDHTGRGLYRMRTIEVDRHELRTMAESRDGQGEPLFNLPEVERLSAGMVEEVTNARRESTGHGQEIHSHRMPIRLDEYVATIIGPDGKIEHDKKLFIVANDQYLVRGPEKNPFWHGHDWLVFSPLVSAPMSVYGRSYMEDFGEVSKTFTELTQLILDATFTSSLKVFALTPGLLLNPQVLDEGLAPNTVFQLEDGVRPQDFFKEVDMGSLAPEAVTVWQALKTELREAAGINEIGLGQFAPKGRTSATEIAETQQSSSALIRSLAQSIETRFLDIILDLVWKTGLQHMNENDEALQAAAGREMYGAIYGARKEIVKRCITFQARGISRLITKARTMRALIQVLQIVGSNELLLQEFLKVVDMNRLVKVLFELSDIDLHMLQASEREKLMRQVATPLQEAAGRPGTGSASDATKREASSVASAIQGLDR